MSLDRCVWGLCCVSVSAVLGNGYVGFEGRTTGVGMDEWRNKERDGFGSGHSYIAATLY